MMERVRRGLRLAADALVECERSRARWELELSRAVLSRGILPLALATAPVLVALAADAALGGEGLPERIPVLGGSKAYMPSVVSPGMFAGSVLVGFVAGLITGVIGAGGGYILTPALMSFGVRGIMAVGTDQFHLFAKAIMGTVVHRRLGNVHAGLASWFVGGSLVGVTFGGAVNRAIFRLSPSLSDAVISVAYVLVLGFLGFYASADWLRLRRPGAARSGSGATTALARRLQALPLRPTVTFDEMMVPGGRRISVYPVIFCGVVVGFAASIMGVGGGFLTFPMFVYGLGVSTFTTVGTDILQIIFTTAYSSIFQYAIHGFVIYSVAVGMLLGSLVGVQVGAMVTRMVRGSHIRAFYALTILAGFANRLCALVRKLAEGGYISLSRGASVAVETAGTVVFFAIVGVFAFWILWVFFRNVGTIRKLEAEATPGASGRLIIHRRSLALGAAGLAAFAALLVAGVIPFGGRSTVIRWADGLMISLAKHSAYAVPEARGRTPKFAAEAVDLGLNPRDKADLAAMAKVVSSAGGSAETLEDGRIRVKGSLGGLASAAVEDADAVFHNRDSAIRGKYGLSPPEVMYAWWQVFEGLSRRYVQEGRSAEAGFAKFLTTRVLEPSYNFRGIEPRNPREHAGALAALLGFYVLYTVWYGFSILLVFEGLGVTSAAAEERKEA